MRLIDAVRLQEEMMEMICEGYGIEDMVDAVIESPAVDAVTVVRCKDCKHRAMDEIGMVYCENIVGGWVSDDFYCADGERRTE